MNAITERLSTALAGRYRIERELGAGGMATVYLAHDLKHDRHVALKVLKPELAAVLGAERFVVEIKTTAALQHPHILPLFDSGTADGFLFYVMPWIEGETLREKLNRETQLGVDEAVRIAREVLDALEYAHQHGIVHRDVKPENILLHGGHAMVADFGIALAVSAAAGGRMTETGLSLGTPFYMSPEQATAEKEITARSDVYSLGSVLYEMLTGNPPHTGASAQQVIMKIIAEPVEAVTKFRKSVPANVAAAVAKSLEKLPADRFESAKSFGDALGNPAYANAAFTGTAAGATGGAAGGWGARVRDPVLIALSALALAATAFGAWAWTRVRQANSVPASRFVLTLLKDQRIIDVGSGGTLAISPDGQTIAFLSQPSPNKPSALFVRPLDQIAATPLAGTETARNVRFSPDGRSLVFNVGKAIKKMSVDGGPTATLATIGGAGAILGLSWEAPASIVVGTADGLWEVPASGGSPRLAVKADRALGEGALRWPLALADGKTVLYMSTPASGNTAGSHIGVASLETGKGRILEVEGIEPLRVLDGELYYVSATGTVMAVHFDPSRGTVTGAQVPLLEDVIADQIGDARVALSATGTLVYLSGTSQMQPLMVDSRGGATPLMAEARAYSTPRFSPDGQ